MILKARGVERGARKGEGKGEVQNPVRAIGLLLRIFVASVTRGELIETAARVYNS